MWIASLHGFFSIVKKRDEADDPPGGAWFVRARSRVDLENLRADASIPVEIAVSEKADYRYRMVINNADMIKVFAALHDSIDYPNFKSEVAKDPYQAEKLPIYEGWWSDMWDYQRNGGPGKKRFRARYVGPEDLYLVPGETGDAVTEGKGAYLFIPDDKDAERPGVNAVHYVLDSEIERLKDQPKAQALFPSRGPAKESPLAEKPGRKAKGKWGRRKKGRRG